MHKSFLQQVLHLALMHPPLFRAPIFRRLFALRQTAKASLSAEAPRAAFSDVGAVGHLLADGSFCIPPPEWSGRTERNAS